MTFCIFLLYQKYKPHPVTSLLSLAFVFEITSSGKTFVVLRGDLWWSEISNHISYTAIYQLFGFSIK